MADVQAGAIALYFLGGASLVWPTMHERPGYLWPAREDARRRGYQEQTFTGDAGDVERGGGEAALFYLFSTDHSGSIHSTHMEADHLLGHQAQIWSTDGDI